MSVCHEVMGRSLGGAQREGFVWSVGGGQGVVSGQGGGDRAPHVERAWTTIRWRGLCLSAEGWWGGGCLVRGVGVGSLCGCAWPK